MKTFCGCIVVFFSVSFSVTTQFLCVFVPQAEDGGKDKEEKDGLWEETFKSHTDSKPNGV